MRKRIIIGVSIVAVITVAALLALFSIKHRMGKIPLTLPHLLEPM